MALRLRLVQAFRLRSVQALSSHGGLPSRSHSRSFRLDRFAFFDLDEQPRQMSFGFVAADGFHIPLRAGQAPGRSDVGEGRGRSPRAYCERREADGGVIEEAAKTSAGRSRIPSLAFQTVA
jgi:hypothetical protein